MKKTLIVGLGNIGDKFTETRHNIGFKVVEQIAIEQKVAFEASNFGEIAQFKYKARPVTLLKPDTYMNLSGNAVAFWMKKENIALENILIITDDLNLPFGTLRMRGKGSDGGHNGLKSIQNVLQTSKYPRLRFGIGNTFSDGRQVDYVLGEWSAEEKEKLQERLETCANACYEFIFGGLNNAMNKFNGK